jgi:ceramide synthetase
MTYYLSLTISQFTDNKRKDFWQMFIHHIVASMVIPISWVCNLHRMGSLMLLVHDSAEVVLEAAKAAKYAKFQKACEILFRIFFITWIVSRLMIFPRLLFETFFRIQLKFFPVMIVFNSLLVLLQILHIYWTYLITQIVVKSLKNGSVVEDVRSDSSDGSEDIEEKKELLRD